MRKWDVKEAPAGRAERAGAPRTKERIRSWLDIQGPGLSESTRLGQPPWTQCTIPQGELMEDITHIEL